MRGVTSPNDETRAELVWREIVENYGDRPALDSDEPAVVAPEPPTDYLVADDEPDEDPIDQMAVVERFQPPTAPPVPLPRTWQRGVAWGGLFVAPALALLIALFGLHPPRLIGWALLAWLVGGFGYLVFDMPGHRRDPWDDGSRV